MKLALWMRQHNLGDAALAQKIDAHRTEVWNWRTERRTPRAPTIAAIERVTRGRVRAKDFDRTA